MKKTILIFLCFLLIFSFTSCKKEPQSNNDPHSEVESVNKISYMAQEQGIAILSACRLTDNAENSTLSHSEDIAGIVVLNNSEKTLQYAEIKGIFSDGTVYTYVVTTLPPKETCYVEEEAYSPYRQLTDGFSGFEISAVTFFTEEPSVRPDKLQFSGADGILNIKNISETDITDDIIVYYKDYKDNQFTSGKTYRITVKGGLAAGELKQQLANHFRQGESVVMFVQFISEVE